MNNHRLNFLELPELKDGENITVRLGDRWFNKVEVGDHILIYMTEDNADDVDVFAEGRITGKQLKPFQDITMSELRKMCSGGSNTGEGLAWNLLDCYPDEFNLESDITLIHFEILPPVEEVGESEEAVAEADTMADAAQLTEPEPEVEEVHEDIPEVESELCDGCGEELDNCICIDDAEEGG